MGPYTTQVGEGGLPLVADLRRHDSHGPIKHDEADSLKPIIYPPVCIPHRRTEEEEVSEEEAGLLSQREE